MTTPELEKLLYKTIWKKGTYPCFEVAVPKAIVNKYHRPRVDMLSYETSGIFRSYELKISKADLHSSAELSWIGNYNYLVCPIELVEEAIKILPKDIGIYAAYDKKTMSVYRKAKKRDLLCDKESMLLALMQGLSREYKKFRKIKEKNV